MLPRQSVPTAAALLLVLIGLLLGSLLLVRRDQRAIASETAEPIAASVSLTTTPRPVEPVPTAVVVPTAAPIRVTSAPPGATLVLDVSIVVVNGTRVALLPGTPTPVIPWWQRSEPIPELLVQPLLAGYLHFWDVRSRALVTLEPAPLREVMAGAPLQAELTAIQNLRGRNQMQRVDVDHAITPLWATDDEGAVLDTLLDRSSVANTDATSEPTSAVQGHIYRMAYRLRRTERGWQVVDFARIDR